jgi:hypothetical protein
MRTIVYSSITAALLRAEFGQLRQHRSERRRQGMRAVAFVAALALIFSFCTRAVAQQLYNPPPIPPAGLPRSVCRTTAQLNDLEALRLQWVKAYDTFGALDKKADELTAARAAFEYGSVEYRNADDHLRAAGDAVLRSIKRVEEIANRYSAFVKRLEAQCATPPGLMSVTGVTTKYWGWSRDDIPVEPPDLPCMSAAEKQTLRDWIQQGRLSTGRTLDFAREYNQLIQKIALRECEPPRGRIGSYSSLASLPPSGAVPPYTFEALAYGGGVSASSFGTSFNPGLSGGRAALSLPLGQFRWQTDLQGERTGNYSGIAGHRSYVAGGSHFDVMVMPGTEVGLFGGLQDAQPTFFGPSNTNYFIGFEGRQFFGPAMIGGQIGRFDAIDKPGTFTNAWFGEARAHLSVGHVVDIPALVRTIISGDVGYGSGTASLTSTGAQTTYWGAQLSHGIANTPFSVFVEYQHFETGWMGLARCGTKICCSAA